MSGPPREPAAAVAAPTRDLLRQVLALAAPTSGVAILQVAAQLIETWLAASQGTSALAGWAVLLPFALLLQQMSTGAMGGGVVSAVARALGAGRRDEASALVLHALLIAVAFGLVFALGLTVFAHTLLTAVAGPAAADAATAYAWWLFGLGAIPTWLANTLASVLRGGGRHGLAARTLVLMWIAYPPLAWALAEPAGFGLAGVGVALALVQSVAAVAMAWVVMQGGAGFVPTLRITPSATLFKRILAVGAVACTLAAIANLTTILVTAQLRGYGVAAVAAYGIAARLEFLVVPLAFGVGSALTALVGRAVGGGDWATARRIAWVGGALALLLTGTIGLVVATWPLEFALFFTDDLKVAITAARGLHSPAWPSAASASAWRCTSRRWGRAACSGPWWRRSRASRWRPAGVVARARHGPRARRPFHWSGARDRRLRGDHRGQRAAGGLAGSSRLRYATDGGRGGTAVAAGVRVDSFQAHARPDRSALPQNLPVARPAGADSPLQETS